MNIDSSLFMSSDETSCKRFKTGNKTETTETTAVVDESESTATDEAWVLTQSQTGGYKCYSMGYAYTIDKPKQSEAMKATKVYWRCEKYRMFKCTGRALSCGLKPPLNITLGHNHPIDPRRKEFSQYRLITKTFRNKERDKERNHTNKSECGRIDLIEEMRETNPNYVQHNLEAGEEQQHDEEADGTALNLFNNDEYLVGISALVSYFRV